MPAVLAPHVDSALANLARMPTTTSPGQPPCVRTQAVFGRAPTGIALPLNRKTTQQAITPLTVTDLEPRQEFVPVPGLQSYIVRPRRDPPDVARVQMRDGRVRLLVQEGHTRLGAAVLRGDTEMPVRVWEFVQTDTGSFVPVVRGRQGIYERIRDRPYQAKLAALSGMMINLPDIRDVAFPTLVGAQAPARPTEKKKKKRRRVQYKGVSLSRRPMAFEVKVLSLSEIPPTLDAAVVALENPDAPLLVTLNDIARFGTQQALLELVRQGAPATILETPPNCRAAIQTLSSQIADDRMADLHRSLADRTAHVARRRLPRPRALALARELANRWAPGIVKRHAKHAVNMAFALGRAAVIEHYRRPREAFDLASRFDKLVSGKIWVDAVIQTAVMDTNTCDECFDVDGEQMELGEARQQELHPPYVKCLGGDQCRCVQIALLSDGSEIEVDEVPEEAYDDVWDEKAEAKAEKKAAKDEEEDED